MKSRIRARTKTLSLWRTYLWPAIHFFSSLLGVSSQPDDQRKVLAVEGPTCWNLSWTFVCNRSSSLPYGSIYFLTEPNSCCSFRNSAALWMVALIFFSLRTIPALPIKVFTSFSLNFATLGRENCAKAFWKSGHLFSTTVQLRPAVKPDFVIRSNN